MTDIFVPAPETVTPEPITTQTPVTDPAAPAETVQKSAEQEVVSPQAETPAGTEDQQQPDQTEKPEPEKKPTDAEAARKARNQERWQRMKQQAADAERRERILLSEIERLQKQGQPDYSKLTDPDEILAEKTAQRLRSSQIEDKQASAREESRERERAMGEAWNAIKDEMRVKAPDFDQVVTDRTPVHARAAPFIVESEKGGEIVYWLGKNPDAARDLYSKFETAPAQAFIELGRIEAKISAPVAKQISTAPKPAPVLQGGVNPPGFDINKASVADTAAMLKKAGLIR